VLEDAGDVGSIAVRLLEPPFTGGSGWDRGTGGNIAEDEGVREAAAPALGFPKNPASVVCLVLSCISEVLCGCAGDNVVGTKNKRHARARTGEKELDSLLFGDLFGHLARQELLPVQMVQ